MTTKEIIERISAQSAAARSAEEYRRTKEDALAYYNIAHATETSSVELLAILLPGLWAEYYRLKKYPASDCRIQERDIDLLVCVAENGYITAEKEVEWRIKYGYLLSIIYSALKEDIQEATAINNELQKLIQNAKDPLVFRIVNAQGIAAMQREEWPEAIALFSQAAKKFPDFFNNPEAWQHLANIFNNRGLARLRLSDGREQAGEKRDLIASAIIDLLVATEFYLKVSPPPLKHIDGIINRFIMAAQRLLLTERLEREVKLGLMVKEAFEAKNREGAKNIILSLKELKVKKWDEAEGDIPGDAIGFIRSIQTGLRMASGFLEKHKAV